MKYLVSFSRRHRHYPFNSLLSDNPESLHLSFPMISISNINYPYSSIAEESRKLYNENKFEQVIRFLNSKKIDGDINALNLLGHAYESMGDIESAMYYYEKGHQLGNVKSAVSLAKILIYDEEFGKKPENRDRTVSLLKKHLNTECVEVYYLIGSAYYNLMDKSFAGENVSVCERDFDNSFKYFLFAAQHHYAYAELALAKIFGLKESNKEETYYWIKRALQDNKEGPDLQIYRIYLHAAWEVGNNDEALEFIEKNGDTFDNDPKFCELKAVIYSDICESNPAYNELAVSYLRKAASLGSVFCAISYSNALIDGTMGLEKNPKAALIYLEDYYDNYKKFSNCDFYNKQRAALCTQLADNYSNGYGCEPDEDKSNYYKELARTKLTD